MPQRIAIERLTALTPEVTALLDALDEHTAGLYLDEQRHGLDAEALFQPNIRFFLARLDGVAIGCGGVELLDGFAEVKRMYTADTARRRGVGAALMARIEAEARDAGAPLLRLETGVLQPEAIALYERNGFQAREPYGRYAEMAPHRISASVFYEKPL